MGHTASVPALGLSLFVSRLQLSAKRVIPKKDDPAHVLITLMSKSAPDRDRVFDTKEGRAVPCAYQYIMIKKSQPELNNTPRHFSNHSFEWRIEGHKSLLFGFSCMPLEATARDKPLRNKSDFVWCKAGILVRMN